MAKQHIEERAISFCELLDPHTLARARQLLMDHEHSRVYLGSNFCARYVLAQQPAIHQILDECRELQMPVTFVIPPITQVLMDSVFSAVQNLVVAFRDVIDELTANDIALFSTLADECNMRINAGRLMSKDVREPRDFERTRYIAAPSIVGDNALLDFFASQEVRVELDPICRVQDGKEMPPGMSCALYDKWCYVSTGNICESASIYRDVTQKFRPSAPCACECLGFASRIDGESGNSYFRHGKTIYAYQPHAHIIDAADVRIIEQPLFDDLFACDATDEAFEQDRW